MSVSVPSHFLKEDLSNLSDQREDHLKTLVTEGKTLVTNWREDHGDQMEDHEDQMMQDNCEQWEEEKNG